MKHQYITSKIKYYKHVSQYPSRYIPNWLIYQDGKMQKTEEAIIPFLIKHRERLARTSYYQSEGKTHVDG